MYSPRHPRILTPYPHSFNSLYSSFTWTIPFTVFSSVAFPSSDSPASICASLSFLCNSQQGRQFTFRRVTYLSNSLFHKNLTVNAVTIKSAERKVMVMNPFWYCGASTCCQTMSGSQACKTYAISFMLAITMALSSLSSLQISCPHLFHCQWVLTGEFREDLTP